MEHKQAEKHDVDIEVIVPVENHEDEYEEIVDDEESTDLDNEQDEQDGLDESQNLKKTSFVKDLRTRQKQLSKELRDKDRALKAMQAELEALKGKPNAPQRKPKPKISEFEYDEDQFESALDEWYEQEAHFKAEERAKAEKLKAEQDEWHKVVNAYRERAAKIEDFDDFESTVLDKLGQDKFVVLLETFDPIKAPIIVKALARNDKELDRLSSLGIGAKFIKELINLEPQIIRKKQRVLDDEVPEVERSIARQPAFSNSTKLKKLQDMADATGDDTELVRYLRSLRQDKG